MAGTGELGRRLLRGTGHHSFSTFLKLSLDLQTEGLQSNSGGETLDSHRLRAVVIQKCQMGTGMPTVAQEEKFP